MKPFERKRLIIALITAGVSAVILIFIEFKYFIGDSAQLSPGKISLFVCQYALLFFFFQAIPCTLNGLNKWRQGDSQLEILGKCGLVLEILSIVFVIIGFVSFSSPYIVSVKTGTNIICCLLTCVAIVLYYRARSKLAISFVLWAIAIWLLEYILTGIGTIS